MGNEEIKVTFETITPLYTGDAWQESKEIRPSSLIGSLRFWFEIICYFGGICSEGEFDKEKGRFEKDIKNDEIKGRLLKCGTDFEGQIEALKELKVPLPAIIFGTTGWKSLIEIKEINNQNNQNSTNNYPLSINRFEKEIKPVCYFKKGFWGKFEVVFRVPEEIKETIFFPLLNFMDRYGYWGGGWNIGYGRLKVLSVNSSGNGWQKDKFDFSKFGKNEISVNDIETVSFNSLTSKDLKKTLEIWKYSEGNLSVRDMLRNLIIKKANLRRNLNDRKERHEIFGYLKPTEGSKILPYINRLDNNTYECGLLSMAGILNLY